MYPPLTVAQTGAGVTLPFPVASGVVLECLGLAELYIPHQTLRVPFPSSVVVFPVVGIATDDILSHTHTHRNNPTCGQQ